MKKRFLVIIFLVLAVATPCINSQVPQVALAASLPVVTEQAAIVVEPGQISQLLVRLNTGDAASGHITVTPQDINLVIKDPDGTIIVNAGMITDKDFSFTASMDGLYKFVLANSIFLTANKVVILRIQHPGPPVLPYFGGTYAAVAPGATSTVTVHADAGQAITGTVQVQGGSQEIVFNINDASGGSVTSKATIRDSYSFNFTPGSAGDYKLSFTNSSSAYTSKLIMLELRADGRAWWWGTAARLVFITSPAGAKAGSEFATQPIVLVQDASGNQASNFFDTVTLAITSGTGTGGAVLSGSVSVKAVAGMAVFNGLSIDLPGSNFSLTASAGNVASATSETFDVARLLPANCVALSAGWNFVSLPVIPDDPAIATVLGDISSSTLSVWYYDTASAKWLSYVPAIGGTLTSMSDGKGYWINMSAPAILAVNSRELTAKPARSPAYPVFPGWNMIGFKSTLPGGAGLYLNGTTYNPFSIYGFASGNPYTVNSNSGMLQPGQGYWVYFYSAGTIKQ